MSRSCFDKLSTNGCGFGLQCLYNYGPINKTPSRADLFRFWKKKFGRANAARRFNGLGFDVDDLGGVELYPRKWTYLH